MPKSAPGLLFLSVHILIRWVSTLSTEKIPVSKTSLVGAEVLLLLVHRKMHPQLPLFPCWDHTVPVLELSRDPLWFA